MRMRTLGALGATLATCALLLVTGCGDDDPAGPSTPANIPASLAEEQVGGSIELANSLIVSLQQLATTGSDGLGGMALAPAGRAARAAEPVMTQSYDGTQWTYSYAESITEQDSEFSIDVSGRLQFLDLGGDPQPEPDESTESMNHDQSAMVSMSFSQTDPGTGATSSTSIRTEVESSSVVTGFVSGPLAIVADGTQSVVATSSGPEGNQRIDFAMTWQLDVELPNGGTCPAGTMSVQFGDWDLQVTYVAGPTATWVLRQGGEVYDAGTETLECGGPVVRD